MREGGRGRKKKEEQRLVQQFFRFSFPSVTTTTIARRCGRSRRHGRRLRRRLLLVTAWSVRGAGNCVQGNGGKGTHRNMAQKSLETPLLGSARSLGEIKLEKTPNDDEADDDGQQDADADADNDDDGDDGSLQWVVVFFAVTSRVCAIF